MSTPNAAPAWACRLNMLLMRIQLISYNNARRLASRVITRRSILHALWDSSCFPSGFPAYRSLWLIGRLNVLLESTTEHCGRLQYPLEDVLLTRFSQSLCCVIVLYTFSFVAFEPSRSGSCSPFTTSRHTKYVG